MLSLKKKILFFCFLFLALMAITGPTLAAEPLVNSDVSNNMAGQEDAFLGTSGLSESATVPMIASTIISIVLGLLGIIFIVLLVYAGFTWMTANGEEDKINKAKGTIMTAVIGLAIIIAAYSITYFVFDSINSAAGDGSSGGTTEERP